MTEVNSLLLFAVIAILFNFIAGLRFIFIDKLTQLNRLLLSLTFLSMSSWGLTQAYLYINSNELAVLMMRLGFTFTGFTIIFFSNFLVTYTREVYSRYKVIVSVILMSLINLIFTLSPIVINGAYLNEDNISVPDTNKLSSSIFSIFILGVVFLMVYTIYRSFSESRIPNLRSNMRFLSIALVITVVLVLVFNIFIPTFIDISPKTSPLIGFTASVIFSFSAFFVFIRERYSDLRIYIYKGFYFFFLAVILYSMFYIVTFFHNYMWGDIYDINSHLSGIMIAGLLAYILIDVINHKYRDLMEHRFQLIGDNIGNLIENFIENVSNIRTYNEFDTTISHLIINQIKLYKRPSIIIFDKNNNLEYVSENIRKFLKKYDEKEFNKFLRYILKPIIINEELLDISDSIVKKRTAKIYLEALFEEKYELIQPLKDNERILGFIFIPQKESRYGFSSQEINFIKSMRPYIILTMLRVEYAKAQQEQTIELESRVKEAIKELTTANSKLEESLRKEKDMIDIFSHELRTPAGTAKNAVIMLDSARRNTEVDEIERDQKVNKYLSIAIENLQRLSGIITRMLNATKLDTSEMTVNIIEIDAIDVVNDSFEAFQKKAEQKGLKLIIEIPSTPLIAKADRDAIQQVIDNLVDNAIKYTDQGEVKLTLVEEKSAVIYTIKDTGRGIPKSELKKLGRKFYRINNYLEESTETNVKLLRPDGTGIGLYVVKGLIELMHGKFEIKSDGENKGSEFIVTIPR